MDLKTILPQICYNTWADLIKYAIKQIAISPSKMEKLNKEGLVDTVLNENRTAAALSHPNVVRYHDSWVETLAIEHSSRKESSHSSPEKTGFS